MTVTILEVFNSIFTITDESNSVLVLSPGYNIECTTIRKTYLIVMKDEADVEGAIN